MPPDPAHPVQPAPTLPTVFVGWTDRGPTDTVVRVSGLDDYLATFGASGAAGATGAAPLDDAVRLFYANGGTDALVVRPAGPAADQMVPVGGGGGLRAVTEGFSVLVLPGLTSDQPGVVERALARCTEERAVLLLDLPQEADPWSAAHRADQVRGDRDRAAVYHPWVVVDGAAVPPSGAVAGVIASTSASRGVAETPAGDQAELQGIDGLTRDLTADESELLTVHGVNALRTFPDRRRVVWGGRLLSATTSSEPSSRYLAVRRLTDHVLRSLEEGMAFVRGRRTDPGLADLVRRRAGDFLTDLWRQGALAGTTPAQAYFVRCDRSTTTESDLAAGLLVLRAGLAVTRPAEFEVHDVVLETSTARGPDLLDAPAAVARATELARERRTVVRRADLAAVASRHVEETERRLSRIFDNAAQARTVLLLEEAETLLGRADGRGHRGAAHLGRVLDRLSRETGVPYVLARRRRRP